MLGAYCKGVSTGGKRSKEDKHFHIHVLELLALKFAILTFTKNLSHLTTQVQVENKIALVFLFKLGGTSSAVSKNQQFDLELSAITSDHNYCRVPSKQVECKSRLEVQQLNRLTRFQTSSENLSENNQTLRNPKSRSTCRSTCLQAVSPTSPIYVMVARTKTFCNRCKATVLEQNAWFCIPTLQLDRSGDKQDSSGKCRSSDTSDTHMADTTLVYSPTKNIHTTSIVFSNPAKPITKSPGRKTSSGENQVPQFSGVENHRKITGKPWKSKEFHAVQPNLISMSRRPGSIAGYESACNKWVSWCCRQQIGPVCALLRGIMNYLSAMFEKGL